MRGRVEITQSLAVEAPAAQSKHCDRRVRWIVLCD